MRYLILYLLLKFIVFQNIVFAQTDINPELRLNFYNDVEGPTGTDGDIISLHIQTFINEDSLFLSTYDALAPVEITLVKPKFNGSFMSFLYNLSKGDSASFIIPVDSYRVHNIPSIGDSGTNIKYIVQVYDINNPTDFKIKKESKIDKRFSEEMSILKKYFRKNKLKPQKTASGLHYIIHKKGNGPRAQLTKKVRVHYSGKTLYGNEFDSSYKRDQPFGFILGLNMVIAGWEEAILLMNVGDKTSVYIPSKLGYGLKGNGEAIPPNSILEFDIELLEMP